MTACVNNQNENKGGVSHKVLRSVVAGVMAVSMVPTTALATEASESELTPLTESSAADAFSTGTVTAAVDAEGNALTVKDGVVEVVANGESQTVIPTELTLKNGLVVDLTTETAQGAPHFTVSNNSVQNVNTTGQTATISAGAGSGYNGASVNFTIKVNPASLDGVFAYEGEIENTDFVYGVKANEIKFAIGEEDVPVSAQFVAMGVNIAGTDATVLPAGEYTVNLTGTSGEYQGAKKTIKLTVEKLNLSDLQFVAEDIATSDDFDYAWYDAEGEVYDVPAADLDVVVKDANGKDVTSVSPKQKGNYTLEVSPKEGSENNITGTSKDSFRIVGTLIDDFEYNGEPIDDDFTKTFTQQQVITKTGFDPSLVTSASATEGLAVTVTKDGKTVTSYDELGTYVVQVDVKTDAANYDEGGSCTFTFKVVKDSFDNQDVKSYLEFDGRVCGAINHEYDGSDIAKSAKVTVKAEDETLKEGTDYELNWYKDSVDEKNKVDEVVNAGKYVLEVKGITYDKSDTYNVTVTALQATAYRLAGEKTVLTGFDQQGDAIMETGLPYTGEEIVPVIEYTNSTNAEIKDGTAEWTVLPAAAYKATITGDVDEDGLVVDAGDYEMTIAKNTNEANKVVADNYDLTNAGTFDFKVVKDTYFNDVKASDWFAVATSTATANGIFAGYDGGVFLPQKSLTRAEAVQVFAKMAGLADVSTQYKQAAAEFSDVSSLDWFANSLGWAKTVGLVSGNADGTFAPNQQITREQFAVMLANYESIFGDFKSADAKVLEGYTDADAVSGYAVNGMAWAVENKIMGANSTLDAQGIVTRAEAATMVVNYMA